MVASEIETRELSIVAAGRGASCEIIINASERRRLCLARGEKRGQPNNAIASSRHQRAASRNVGLDESHRRAQSGAALTIAAPSPDSSASISS